MTLKHKRRIGIRVAQLNASAFVIRFSFLSLSKLIKVQLRKINTPLQPSLKIQNIRI